MSAQATLPQAGSMLSIHQAIDRYAPYLAACRNSLTRDLARAPAAKYLASYFERGKMIRPMLVFLSAAAVGGEAIDALPAAEAMEMLHVAALLHDDIIDGAEERRGLPALHQCIGEAATIGVGDYLILKAFDVLARAAENAPSFSKQCVCSANMLNSAVKVSSASLSPRVTAPPNCSISPSHVAKQLRSSRPR